MRVADHYVLGTVSASGVPGSVELGEARELGAGSLVAVWCKDPGKMNPRGPHVAGAPANQAEVVIHAGGVSADITVPEIARDHAHAQQLHLIAGRQGIQILLEPGKVDGRV